MDVPAKVTPMETDAPPSPPPPPPSEVAPVSAPAAEPVVAPPKDAEMAEEDGEAAENESDDDDSEDSEDEEAEEAEAPAVELTGADGRPLSDIEIAAQYAAIEIQSMSSQLASTVVDVAKPTVAAAVPSSSTTNGVSAAQEVEGDKAEASSSDEDSSDEDGAVAEDEDPGKLRAEIEAAMEKEENKASGPLKTANEVAAVPVREPEVKELTPDCPIARCGVVLNLSRPGLIVTVKSDAGVKPLDEGSVLCLEDRTVLGCVDEIFGPVLMPMYLVRFENAEKIPAQADINKPVFYATEHTTYIIPENIRDKGTDASNIFDEETDEAIYSDDEAEAVAKRQNRKRNRGENAAPGAAPTSGPPGNFSDYQPGRSHGGRGGGGGRGRGRGGRGQNAHHQYQPQHHHPAQHIQSQPHGGYTRYTSPGYAQPGMPPYPPAAGQYQSPAYGAPAPYQQQGHYPPPPPVPVYGQPPYGAPRSLPPYPPQAPPPNYYAPPQGHGYAPPPPPPPQGHYAPLSGYYQQPDTTNPYGHQPPPPPGGRYH